MNIAMMDAPLRLMSIGCGAGITKARSECHARRLDTVVGERGIAFGRPATAGGLGSSLISQGDLILLDDVLSAVDHENESRLVKTLNQLEREGKADLCHRIQSDLCLPLCSKILVLEDGVLVAEGSHAELVNRDGPYRDAWHAQRRTHESKSTPNESQGAGLQTPDASVVTPGQNGFCLDAGCLRLGRLWRSLSLTSSSRSLMCTL